MIGRASRRAGRGQEVSCKDGQGGGGREGTGGPPRGPRGVGSSSRYVWMGRETLPLGRAVLGGPPGVLGGVGRPIQIAGGIKALPK